MEFRDGDLARITIAAGKSLVFGSQGEIVRCYEANGELEVTFNNGTGRSLLAAGTARRAQNGGIFEKFEIHNNNNFDVMAVIGWAYGDLIDNRMTIAGHVPVQNVLGEELNVFDQTAHTKINQLRTELKTTINQVKMSVDQTKSVLQNHHRQSVMNFGGTKYAMASNSEVTISKPGKILLIRTCAWSTTGINHESYLEISGNRVTPKASASTSNLGGVLENYVVPEGRSVKLVSISIHNPCYCFYEEIDV